MSEEKLPKATHSGTIDLNGFSIECYNLNNGERVLSRIGFLRALGRTGKAKGGRKYDDEFQTPVFLTANNLKEFIPNDLLENSKPILFQDLNGVQSIGYKAELLPTVCFVFMDAQEKGKLKQSQLHIAEQAKKIVRAFATLGIIALVDEATGYQYDREKHELQAILKAFISDEILDWQKAFHLNFYKEIFRLWGVPFTEKNIKRKPQFIGKLTNELVYKNLPKGTVVLSKLKEKTPKTEGGNYKYRLHQSLTPDVGREALKKVIYSIETLAMISEDKEKFKRLVQDRFGQKFIPFPEYNEPDQKYKQTENEEPKQIEFNDALKGLLNVPPPEKNK